MAVNLKVRIERLDRALSSVEVACKSPEDAGFLLFTDEMRRQLRRLQIRLAAREPQKPEQKRGRK